MQGSCVPFIQNTLISPLTSARCCQSPPPRSYNRAKLRGSPVLQKFFICYSSFSISSELQGHVYEGPFEKRLTLAKSGECSRPMKGDPICFVGGGGGRAAR